MSRHTATTHWRRPDSQSPSAYLERTYAREHWWHFDGGAEVLASSSPHTVRPPYSNPAGVDPEEAFVASLSSCHLLWFLSIAAEAGYVVEEYRDAAEGVLATGADGRVQMTRVTLRPQVTFDAERAPDAKTLEQLHHDAHDKCFIASSVKTEVIVEPQ